MEYELITFSKVNFMESDATLQFLLMIHTFFFTGHKACDYYKIKGVILCQESHLINIKEVRRVRASAWM
jgi:hypothetical protein